MSTESNGTPLLDLIAQMNAASLEASDLPDDQLMIARIAALVAVDAAPASYMVNLGAAGSAGVDEDQVRGVLCAIAPIVGTARTVSAAGKMMRAMGLALGLAELEAEAELEEEAELEAEAEEG
jgi:hypothetical protein